MRFVGILLVFASFPFFWWLLKSRARRRFAFTALGALPLLHLPLNMDAALIDWATWPGHTKGLLLTLLDSLSLAICVRYAGRMQRPPLYWLFFLYLACLVPGLFVGPLFQPAFFFLFQVIRLTLLFYAVYLLVRSNHIGSIARGMALGVLSSAFFALKGAFLGVSQAPGLLGHQNLSGMAVNLCVPLLVALGLQKNGGFLLAAAAGGGVSAIAGGSRATIVFYAVAVIGTLIGSVLIRPTARKTGIVAMAFVGVLAASPFALQKLSERGGQFTIDPERVAFEKAAKMMINDHPWGVGTNQYVTTANTGGYLTRAGVRWGQGARATNVHNFYLLVRTEAGPIGVAGLLIWLMAPFLVAAKLASDRRAPLREVNVAVAVTLVVTAMHSRYEWITVTIVPQYLIAVLIGIVSATISLKQERRPGTGAREPVHVEGKELVELPS